jgi:hypothetical protein
MTLNVTLLDVLKFKGLNGREIVNEVIKNCPAFTGNDTMGHNVPIATDTIAGDSFKGLYRIGLPDAKVFRKINAGASMVQGKYETRRFEVHNAGRYFWIDRALMRRDPDAGSRLLAAQCANGVEELMNGLERQFYYGGQKSNGNPDPDGFQGLQTFIDPSMIYDAGGNGSTAQLTSAYLVNFNNRNGCTWLFGEQGEMSFSDPVEDDITDPADPAKRIPVVKTDFEFYPGFAFLSKFAASRIANIDVATAFTTSKNRTAFTDEHIATAIAMWQTGAPNAILMTKAAGMMLAASRTVTTIAGANGGADIPVQSGYVTLPSEHNGIPIAYTDALTNAEKKVTV